MNKRTILALGVLVILVIIVGLFYITKTPSVLISSGYSVPTSFSSAVAYGNNSVVYSKGQGLLTYGLTTGKVSTLGPTSVGLNIIDTISTSSDGNYVLFHDQQLTQGGGLANQLTSEGLNPQLGYWWLYSTSNQTFSHLPQNTVLAKLVSGGLYGLSPGSNNETLTSYSPVGLSEISSLSVPGSTNFYPYKSGYLLQTPNNQLLYTTDGIVNQVILKSASLVGVDGDTAVAVKLQNGSHSLLKINLGNYQTKTVAGSVIGQPAWLNPGYTLYTGNSSTSLNSKIYEYNLSNNSTNLWKLTDSINLFGSAGPTINSLVSPTSAIISGSSSNYYLIGNQVAQPSGL